MSRGVLPVICGGTNYYIESLLWKVLIDQEKSASASTQTGIQTSQEEEEDENGSKRLKTHDDHDVNSDSMPGKELNEEKNKKKLDEGAEVGFEDAISNADLYDKLKEVDPERAKELHPNDRRKVARSLQGKVFLIKGLGK